ncbi:MAG TPA: hypothetical protein VK444_02420 [Methanobacteriaceae archaeon]|nr:hypothetical protein [Methanobacteriaceae archaeon]
MDVAVLRVEYLNGNKENYNISTPEVDKIKIMEDRIIISFGKDLSTGKKKCKVIITENLTSYEISPCDERDLVASFG